MTPSEWSQLKVWFGEAAELPPADRGAVLARARRQAPHLTEELEALLRAHDTAGAATLALTPPPPQAAEEPSWPPGAAIGPYRVLAELGRGGSGVVLLAERADDEFHRPVALKLLLRSGAALLAERRALARLQHPHIATLLDWGSTDEGTAWLATEYIFGLPIDEYCRRHRLGRDQILALAIQACDAIAYAHAQAVIHCDLKPGNILVRDDGILKLLDFGIAQAFEPGAAAGAATGVTPHYASPEQWRGEPALAATDVYALGVVMGQLLSGALPPDLAQVDAEAARVLRHALESAGAQRYATAAAFKLDLERLLQRRPPLEVPTPWRRRMQLFGRRNTLPLVLTAGLVLAGALAAALWTLRSRALPPLPVPVRPAPALSFAPTGLGQSGLPLPLTVIWHQATDIARVAVVTQGAPDLDFTSSDAGACAGWFPAGASCTLHVQFAPTAAGRRLGAVLMYNAAGQVSDRFYIAGTGVGAAVAGVAAAPVRTITGLDWARGLSADGAGDIFLVETRTGRVDEIPAGTSRVIRLAHLNIVSGATAVDGAGQVFASSTDQQAIFEVNASGAHPWARTPAALLLDDNLVADGAGNLFASDQSGVIFMIPVTTRVPALLQRGGAGHRFVGMAMDAHGNLICPDYSSGALFELPAAGTTLLPLPAPDGHLSAPHAIALDGAGDLYIADDVADAPLLRYAAGTLRFSQLAARGTHGLTFDGHGHLWAVLNNDTVVEYALQPPVNQ